MSSFLEHIVADIQEEELSALKDKCFVFPTRRACLHFHNLLAMRFESKVFISPAVQSIEEFIQEQSPGLVVADELTLLFKLFKAFKKEEPELSFENFYVWGQTLLRDFDEIDRYLVDGQKVYQNLHEIQDIEATFGPNEEMQKAFLEFQKVIEVSGNSKLFKSFLENWLRVGRILPGFKAQLKEDGIAYIGLCYRQVAEQLAENNLIIPYQKIIFAGFNALSLAEEQIIDLLLQKGQAEVYFDADEYYLDDEEQEAGKFLRHYRKKWRNHQINWVITNGFAIQKQIEITGVSQKVVQARQAAQNVTDSVANGINTAIVMADESLLFPLLYAIPDDSELNITMGYSLLSSGVGGLITAYLRYQAAIAENSRNSDNPLLDQQAFLQLISQPVLQFTGTNELTKAGHVKSHWVSWQKVKTAIVPNDLQKFILLVLQPARDTSNALEALVNTILSIQMATKEKGEPAALMEEQITVTSVKYLENLRNILIQDKLQIDFYTLERVVNETLKQQKVPFAGEPLIGLQVMGFLETRTLDFDHLVLMSVNEGLLPSSSSSKTYLPFGLRKAFGLPTFIEHNSIYAYHFFRLLQRASKISLIYNSELAFDGSGEKSRFILQLIQNLKSHTNIELTENIIVTPIKDKTAEHPLIQIEKTGEALKNLKDHKNDLSVGYLSPTALLNYVECSLKYYFSKILKIKSPDVESAEIDARDFGNLLHQVMEDVYSPYLNQVLNTDDIDKIRQEDLSLIIEKCFREYLQYHTQSSEITFVQHVIEHLANKMLKQDAKDAPLKILDLESRNQSFEHVITLKDGSTVKLGGKIDRLDEVKQEHGWLHRILDYKTGKFELGKATFNRKPLSDEDYIAQYFTNPDFKSGFQTYFYALLFNKKYPKDNITGGIIGAKNVNRGIAYLRGVKSGLPMELIQIFEQKLQGLVEELFDLEVPFVQTEDEKRCVYCDFKQICNR